MTIDFQRREARQCLWDNDGHHTPKKARNRGKARGKDKRLVREELLELETFCDAALVEFLDDREDD